MNMVGKLSERGQVYMRWLIEAVLVTAIILTLVPALLASRIVLSAGEYANITSTLTTLLLHNENETFLFPESVSDTVTLTAGNGVNTFGAWAEVVDNNPTSLATVFVANTGYLVEIMLRTYSVPNEIYIVELATDNAGANVIGRVKVRSDWTYVLTLRSARVPAGSTIYYRMKAQTALATVVADFRYYYR